MRHARGQRPHRDEPVRDVELGEIGQTAPRHVECAVALILEACLERLARSRNRLERRTWFA